jgi:hypothetical protein
MFINDMLSKRSRVKYSKHRRSPERVDEPIVLEKRTE